MLEKLQYYNPIVTKHTNIYLFEEFGLGIAYEFGYGLIIVLGFIRINIFFDRKRG